MPSESLRKHFSDTRNHFLAICEPLQVEDFGLQAAVFASPPKWHLAHTTWFFETFILKPFAPDYAPLEPLYEVIFNSYYNGIGQQHPRDQRGLLSRPSLDEVLHYRAHVETAIVALLRDESHPQRAAICERLTLGIEHERQHQELFFTDLKYSFSTNPLYPAYLQGGLPEAGPQPPLSWQHYDGGLFELGYCGKGFCFDNELPRHQSFLQPFAMANRLTTNAEYQAFIDDAGYQRAELWLADGWAAVQAQGWTGPLHWHERDGEAIEYTLYGMQPRVADLPVCHVSGFEADAFARWSDARLPTEPEWERVANDFPEGDSESDEGACHPQAAQADAQMTQLYGGCWQWTQTAYSPYPGFRAAADAIGEYNGKFMSNQWVLRGSSCVTAKSQSRRSYRNFFYPQDRWQFSGIRLARDLEPEAAS